MIRLENVSFGYKLGGSTVTGLSFHIKEGEFVALLGHNGAGKTTTAKLIDGLLKPDTGRVTVGGLDTATTRVSERAANVGYLFQNPDRQICQNSVREELAFGLKAVRRDMSAQQMDKRVQEMLDAFGFSGEEEPFSLSRGERQRVALASVITVQPKILILDEPTTGLDYKECCQIMDIISDMNEKNGTTIVMVCHDMEVVSDYARRALVLSGGRLLADGKVRDIFRDRALMEKASLLPPQIVELSLRLGAGYEKADTIEQMTQCVTARLKQKEATA